MKLPDLPDDVRPHAEAFATALRELTTQHLSTSDRRVVQVVLGVLFAEACKASKAYGVPLDIIQKMAAFTYGVS